MEKELGALNISEASRRKLKKLALLNREKVGDFGLLVKLKPILLPPRGLFSGKTYFNIYFKNVHGRLSQKPVIDRALYSVGGKGVSPWIEIGHYWPEVIFEEKGRSTEVANITNTDIEWRLFKLLGDLIPCGGHMMVPYELDDNVLSRMTFASLPKNVPMVATPIGFLLFRIGFTIPFKDWHISEGGHEGPRKLQFEKPSSDRRARGVFKEIIDQLGVFTEGHTEREDADLVRCCKNNAYKIRNMILKGMLNRNEG